MSEPSCRPLHCALVATPRHCAGYQKGTSSHVACVAAGSDQSQELDVLEHEESLERLVEMANLAASGVSSSWRAGFHPPQATPAVGLGTYRLQGLIAEKSIPAASCCVNMLPGSTHATWDVAARHCVPSPVHCVAGAGSCKCGGSGGKRAKRNV